MSRLASSAFAFERRDGSGTLCEAFAGVSDLRIDQVFDARKYAADTSMRRDASAAKAADIPSRPSAAATKTDGIPPLFWRLDGMVLASIALGPQVTRAVTFWNRNGGNCTGGKRSASTGALVESRHKGGDEKGADKLALGWSFELGTGMVWFQHREEGKLLFEWETKGPEGGAIAALLNGAVHFGDQPCPLLFGSLAKAAFAYFEETRDAATAEGLFKALKRALAKLGRRLDKIGGDDAGCNNGFGNGPDCEPPGHEDNEHASRRAQDDGLTDRPPD